MTLGNMTYSAYDVVLTGHDRLDLFTLALNRVLHEAVNECADEALRPKMIAAVLRIMAGKVEQGENLDDLESGKAGAAFDEVAADAPEEGAAQ